MVYVIVKIAYLVHLILFNDNRIFEKGIVTV